MLDLEPDLQPDLELLDLAVLNPAALFLNLKPIHVANCLRGFGDSGLRRFSKAHGRCPYQLGDFVCSGHVADVSFLQLLLVSDSPLIGDSRGHTPLSIHHSHFIRDICFHFPADWQYTSDRLCMQLSCRVLGIERLSRRSAVLACRSRALIFKSKRSHRLWEWCGFKALRDLAI